MQKLLILIGLIFILFPSQSQILINEIMTDNKLCIMDADGDYSDWIELYNHSNQNVNLNNYSLSDERENLTKWKFPDITINNESTLLIFASGKDVVTNSEIHTNFKLSSSGEFLYLSNASGFVIDSISPIHLGEDDSYGRLPDGSSYLTHLDFFSPNESNNNTSQLVFSNSAGFYEKPFKLSISSLLNDSIYYSLDGSIPDMNSYLLTDSILIYDNSSNPNYYSTIITTYDTEWPRPWPLPSEKIDKANIIRCVSYNKGIPSSNVYTQTYFVDTLITQKYDLPVISLVTSPENLFDHNIGIYVPGTHYDDNDYWLSGNYFQKGLLWERPVHIEYFDDTGYSRLSQDAGIRIHGGRTRGLAQKTLRLYAREEYGKKYFNYNLLPNTDNNNYKRFLLRTTFGGYGGENSIIKDEAAHSIAREIGLDTQDFNHAIVFINGEYWGIHGIRDYIDENYIAYKYNIDKDSIDIIEEEADSLYLIMRNVFSFIENNNLNDMDAYEHIKNVIDINNYIDYQITEMFLQNKDWPGNNMKFWRSLGGKWRFIFFDLDYGLYDPFKNMFSHCTTNDETIDWPNPPASTYLFRELVKNPLFVNEFLNRAQQLLNEYFLVDKMKEKTINIKETLIPSINKQINRWGMPLSYEQWEEDINKIINFLELRPCQFAYNLVDFFDSNNLSYDWAHTFCSDDSESQDDIIVYPNPNNGVFSIKNKTGKSIDGRLFITNINGVIIYDDFAFHLESNEKDFFYFSHLSDGLYVLHFTDPHTLTSTKFIVSNN